MDFYNIFSLKRRTKYIIMVCENSSVAVSDLIPHILKVTNAIPTDF